MLHNLFDLERNDGLLRHAGEHLCVRHDERLEARDGCGGGEEFRDVQICLVKNGCEVECLRIPIGRESGQS